MSNVTYEQHEYVAEEEQVICGLRSACTPYGDEMSSRLKSSSLMLLSYGRVQAIYATRSEGLEKRKYFIKAAVLMFAAKSRLEMIGDKDHLEEVTRAIDNFYIMLVGHSGGKHPEILGITSANVKKRFVQLREAQVEELSKLEVIEDDASKKMAIQMQRRRIETVKRLLDKNTKAYEALMYYIAQKCESVLGARPCQFALVGLGSLARKEVTLYSDFKYILVLEEGVQYWGDYWHILEYFRRLAVLIAVVIIGLGETIITSVEFEHLNNSEAVGKNWFHDVHTPSGVAIDGMMPLVYGPSSIQLIQPVSKMMSCLSSQNDSASDGYRLKNLLRHSCFIYGNKEVYEDYSGLVVDRLSTERCTFREIAYLIAKNVDHVWNFCPYTAFGNPRFNSDNYFYESLSSCLGYIGRFFNWRCSSGFEIIASLKNFPEFGVICGQFPKCHYTELALSLACELRMKCYAAGGGSRRRTLCESIFRYMERCCFQVIPQQVWTLSRYLEVLRRYVETNMNGKLPELKYVKMFGSDPTKWENSLKEQLDLLEKNKNLHVFDKRLILELCAKVCVVIYEKYCAQKDKSPAILEDIRRYILRNPEYYVHGTTSYILIDVYINQKKYSDALRACEEHSKYWVVKSPEHAMKIRLYQVGALVRCHTKSETMDYAEKALRECRDMAGRLVFNLIRVLQDTSADGTRTELRVLSSYAVKEGVKELGPNQLLGFLNELVAIQYQHQWFSDAALTISQAHAIAESKLLNLSGQRFPNLMGRQALACYLELLPQAADFSETKTMTAKVFHICIFLQFADDVKSAYRVALEHLLNEIKKRKNQPGDIYLLKRAVLQIPEEMKSESLLKEAFNAIKPVEQTKERETTSS